MSMEMVMMVVMTIFFLCSICNQYSTIADKVSETPANTAELVSLIEYLKKSSDVTVFKLRRQLRDASERLEFLMDYADLPSKSVSYMCSCMLVFLYKYENVLYLYFKNENLEERRFLSILLLSLRKTAFQMLTS